MNSSEELFPYDVFPEGGDSPLSTDQPSRTLVLWVAVASSAGAIALAAIIIAISCRALRRQRVCRRPSPPACDALRMPRASQRRDVEATPFMWPSASAAPAEAGKGDMPGPPRETTPRRHGDDGGKEKAGKGRWPTHKSSYKAAQPLPQWVARLLEVKRQLSRPPPVASAIYDIEATAAGDASTTSGLSPDESPHDPESSHRKRKTYAEVLGAQESSRKKLKVEQNASRVHPLLGAIFERKFPERFPVAIRGVAEQLQRIAKRKTSDCRVVKCDDERSQQGTIVATDRTIGHEEEGPKEMTSRGTDTSVVSEIEFQIGEFLKEAREYKSTNNGKTENECNDISDILEYDVCVSYHAQGEQRVMSHQCLLPSRYQQSHSNSSITSIKVSDKDSHKKNKSFKPSERTTDENVKNSVGKESELRTIDEPNSFSEVHKLVKGYIHPTGSNKNKTICSNTVTSPCENDGEKKLLDVLSIHSPAKRSKKANDDIDSGVWKTQKVYEALSKELSIHELFSEVQKPSQVMKCEIHTNSCDTENLNDTLLTSECESVTIRSPNKTFSICEFEESKLTESKAAFLKKQWKSKIKLKKKSRNKSDKLRGKENYVQYGNNTVNVETQNDNNVSSDHNETTTQFIEKLHMNSRMLLKLSNLQSPETRTTFPSELDQRVDDLTAEDNSTYLVETLHNTSSNFEKTSSSKRRRRKQKKSSTFSNSSNSFINLSDNRWDSDSFHSPQTPKLKQRPMVCKTRRSEDKTLVSRDESSHQSLVAYRKSNFLEEAHGRALVSHLNLQQRLLLRLGWEGLRLTVAMFNYIYNAEVTTVDEEVVAAYGARCNKVEQRMEELMEGMAEQHRHRRCSCRCFEKESEDDDEEDEELSAESVMFVMLIHAALVRKREASYRLLLGGIIGSMAYVFVFVLQLSRTKGCPDGRCQARCSAVRPPPSPSCHHDTATAAASANVAAAATATRSARAARRRAARGNRAASGALIRQTPPSTASSTTASPAAASTPLAFSTAITSTTTATVVTSATAVTVNSSASPSTPPQERSKGSSSRRSRRRKDRR